MGDEKVNQLLAENKIVWQFNLSRAPWWGGQFERMVGLVKNSLNKIVTLTLTLTLTLTPTEQDSKLSAPRPKVSCLQEGPKKLSFMHQPTAVYNKLTLY